MTELRFELPTFVRLSEPQIAIINDYAPQLKSNILVGFEDELTLDEIKEKELKFACDFFDRGNFSMPGGVKKASLSNRPIGRFDDETSTWHFDGVRGENSFFGVACSVYPTEFAECDVYLDHEACAEFMNDSSDYEELRTWTPAELELVEFGFDDYFSLFTAELDKKFGHDWLIKTSLDNNSKLRSLVSVSNLSIVQALPGVFAYGDIEKILHRMPSEPSTVKRNLFRAFS